jgi:hypothetical protein
MQPVSQNSQNTSIQSLPAQSRTQSPFEKLPQALCKQVVSFIFGDGSRYACRENMGDMRIFQVNREWRKLHALYIKQNPLVWNSFLVRFGPDIRRMPASQRTLLLKNDKELAKTVQTLDLVANDLQPVDIEDHAFHFENLRHFKSIDGLFDLASFQALSRFTKLESLKLTGSFYADDIDQGLRQLSTLSNLEEVRLSFGSPLEHLTSEGVKALIQLPKIKRLYFDTDRSIQSAFHFFIERNNQFEALRLGGLQEVEDASWEAFFKAQPNLREFRVVNPVKLTDATFRNFCTEARRLKNLSITIFEPCELTMYGFINLSKLPELEEFELNLHIPQENIDLLMQELCKCKHLKRLYLPASMALTGKYLRMLADHLGQLEIFSINLQNPDAVTDADFQYFAARMSNLKNLHLLNFKKITNASIQILSTKLVNLEWLDLIQADAVTKEAFAFLAELPKLREIAFEQCAQIQMCDENFQELSDKIAAAQEKRRDFLNTCRMRIAERAENGEMRQEARSIHVREIIEEPVNNAQ